MALGASVQFLDHRRDGRDDLFICKSLGFRRPEEKGARVRLAVAEY